MCQSSSAWAPPCWIYAAVRGREFTGALLVARQNRHWRPSSRLWTSPKSTQACCPDQPYGKCSMWVRSGQCSVEDGAVGTIQWHGYSPPSSFNLKVTSESSISSNGSASLLISEFNIIYIQGLFMNSFNFFFQRKKIFLFLILLYFLYQINYLPEYTTKLFFLSIFLIKIPWNYTYSIFLFLFCVCVCVLGASLVVLAVKNLPANAGDL